MPTRCIAADRNHRSAGSLVDEPCSFLAAVHRLRSWLSSGFGLPDPSVAALLRDPTPPHQADDTATTLPRLGFSMREVEFQGVCETPIAAFTVGSPLGSADAFRGRNATRSPCPEKIRGSAVFNAGLVVQ